MATKTKAARTTAVKAGKAANEARTNPYLQRFVEDPELRDNVREAIEHARKAYKRLNNGKGPAKALMEDKKLQKELHAASEHLKDAGVSLRGKRRKRRGRKLFFLMVIGAIAFVALNEGARKTLMDKVFGAEEEFEYTSTTSPA
jgi:hypothetical protein